VRAFDGTVQAVKWSLIQATSPFRSRAFVTGLAVTFFVFFAIGSLFPIVPRLVTHGLRGDEADVGRISASFALAAICCRPFLSFILRQGVRRLGLVGAALLVGGVALMLRATNLVMLAGCEVLVAFGETFIWTSVATFTTASIPAERQAEAIALGSGPIFVGYAIGPLTTDRFALHGHFHTALLVPLASAVIATALAVQIRSEWAPGKAVRRGRLKAREVFHPDALRPGIAYLFVTTGWSAWSAYIALRADRLGMKGVSGLFVVYSVVSLTIRFFGARIPERIGLTRCALATTTSIACGLAVIGFSHSPLGLYAGAVFIATGISLMFPTMSAISLRGLRDPTERGALLSSISMFFDVGVGLGGIVLGPFARDRGIDVAFRIGAVIVICALPLVSRLRVSVPAATDTATA
jgi:predicted MFS family arabinose efflux permease